MLWRNFRFQCEECPSRYFDQHKHIVYSYGKQHEEGYANQVRNRSEMEKFNWFLFLLQPRLVFRSDVQCVSNDYSRSIRKRTSEAAELLPGCITWAWACVITLSFSFDQKTTTNSVSEAKVTASQKPLVTTVSSLQVCCESRDESVATAHPSLIHYLITHFFDVKFLFALSNVPENL